MRKVSTTRFLAGIVAVGVIAVLIHVLTYLLSRIGAFGQDGQARDLLNDLLLLFPMLWLLNALIFKIAGTKLPQAFVLNNSRCTLQRQIWLGIGGCLLMLLPVILVVVVLLLSGGNLDQISSPGSEKLALTLRHSQTPLVIIVALFESCISGVLVEECFCRGFVYNWSRARMSFWPAALLSALIWGALHQSVLALIFYVPAGITLAAVYEKSGRLTAPVVTHSLWNFVLCCVNLFLFSAK